MKRILKSFAFWMIIIAILLILGREFIYTTSQGQNVLVYANLPLVALLQTFFIGIILPIPNGGSFTNLQVLLMWLPYYFLYVISYAVYGLIIDLVIKKIRKPNLTKQV